MRPKEFNLSDRQVLFLLEAAWWSGRFSNQGLPGQQEIEKEMPRLYRLAEISVGHEVPTASNPMRQLFDRILAGEEAEEKSDEPSSGGSVATKP